MFIVDVIPIKKGFGKESLSYFSKNKINEGSLVKIPIRGKSIWGIVSHSSLAAIKKSELKSSNFAVKKISESAKEVFFEGWWLRSVKKIANYFAVSSGSVMTAFIPSLALDNINQLVRTIPLKKKSKRKDSKSNIKSEILCIQTDEEERYGYYRSAIREEFAKKHSVFICLPTHEEIKRAELEFEKGIEKYTYVFHSGMSKQELLKKWNAALSENHPILIIATPKWLLMPRHDIGTIILDKESSSAWRTIARPFIDMRKGVEYFARERGSRLIFGDTVLRIETIWRLKNDEIIPFEPVKFRINSPAQSLLYDMKEEKVRESNSSFQILSQVLIRLIKKAEEEDKKIFIYATRKGLSPVTVCSDCGEEVLCSNCKSPVVLYKSRNGEDDKNIFRCHQCGNTRTAKEVCKKCGSWRLQPLGIGIERVVEEIKKAFKDSEISRKIFEISKDATTAQGAHNVIQKFYNSKSAILVGTEMAFYYLHKPVDYTAIVSIDSLFSVPDFKIREKIFHLVLNMKLFAKERCLVQTRNAEKNTLELALAGNLLDFYKMEIEERESLEYPPYSVFIKITIRGEKSVVEKESNFLEQFFDKWHPVVFNSISERREYPAAANCVLKIDRNIWPYTNERNAPPNELLQKILSLPPYFEVKIDPENLL